jgi:hypothetical protein
MQEVDGPIVATWYARDGQTDSGWIMDISLTEEVVWVTVKFIPADGDPPVNMEILNPAGGTSFGWLQRGVCHAIEIQFPPGARVY